MKKTLFAAVAVVCALNGRAEVCFEKAEPVWPAGLTNAINASVGFVSSFDWDGTSPLVLRMTGCTLFKAYVNGAFAAYGPARGPHGWFRVDEWDLAKVAAKGRNRLYVEGVAYNTTTYCAVDHAPFLQAEVLAGGKVLRATGDGRWMAVKTPRVRQTPRYSLQRAQSEVYEIWHSWDYARRGVVGWTPVTLDLQKQPPVKLLERGAPYPDFAIDTSYRPVAALSVSPRTGDLGQPPHIWNERDSFLGRTYPSETVQYIPTFEWWKRRVEVRGEGEGEGEERKIDSSCGIRYEGAINNTGFLRVKVKVTKPGRLLVGFDEVLVDGRLDFVRRSGCQNIVAWNVKEPGTYEFESFEPYTFKYAEVLMLEGEAEIEKLELRTYRNPNATRACTSDDPSVRKVFAAARENFVQNAVDVFTDCPGRERAGWLCDSYFTGPAEQFFTGANEIERTFLRNFALAESFPHLPEGMIPMCYPADHINANFIPNWSMWFVLEVANYFERTGDRETVDLLRPRVEGLVRFYAKYLNGDGLLENLPGWVFVEWSHANEKKLVKDGVSYPSNMTYSEVLDKVAKLYGDKALAAQAEKVRATIRARSFDGTWFRDNDRQPDVTETCQYYAFFHGVATPKSHPELWKKLTDEFGPERKKKGLYKDVWPSNAFIGNLLRLIVLKRAGLAAQVKREVLGYYLGMAERTGTLWEFDSPTASCNHGFASYIALLLDDGPRTLSGPVEVSTVCREEGRYVGWPTVCRRANGELLVVFSGDRNQHVCPFGKVQMVRSTDDGRTWSAPVTLQQSPYVDSRDAGIVELKDGTLVLDWFTSIAYKDVAGYEEHFRRQPVDKVREALGYWTARSTDGGLTWEKPVRTRGTRPHNAVELKDGRLLMLGTRMGNEGHVLPDEVAKIRHEIICEESRDGGRSWSQIASLPTAEGVDINQLYEPYVTELADGTLLGVVRYHGFSPLTKGTMSTCQTESHDGGRTWTPIRPLAVEGYPAHLLTLKDGRILMSFAKRLEGRCGEYAVFSSDGGKTWRDETLLLPWVDGDLGYPSSVQLADGAVLTVFYQPELPKGKPAVRAVRWRP